MASWFGGGTTRADVSKAVDELVSRLQVRGLGPWRTRSADVSKAVDELVSRLQVRGLGPWRTRSADVSKAVDEATGKRVGTMED